MWVTSYLKLVFVNCDLDSLGNLNFGTAEEHNYNLAAQKAK